MHPAVDTEAVIWTPTVIVAVIGTLATMVTAVAGFIVSARLARTSFQRETRRERYRELLELYARLGRAMVAMTQIVRGVSGSDSASEEEADAMIAELEREYPETREQSFSVAELKLYGASPSVVEAYEAWWDYLQFAFGGPPGELTVVGSELLPTLEGLIDRFQSVAGEHARSVLLRERREKKRSSQE